MMKFKSIGKLFWSKNNCNVFIDELKKAIAEDKKNGAFYLNKKADFTKWNQDNFFSKL